MPETNMIFHWNRFTTASSSAPNGSSDAPRALSAPTTGKITYGHQDYLRSPRLPTVTLTRRGADAGHVVVRSHSVPSGVSRSSTPPAPSAFLMSSAAAYDPSLRNDSRSLS